MEKCQSGQPRHPRFRGGSWVDPCERSPGTVVDSRRPSPPCLVDVVDALQGDEADESHDEDTEEELEEIVEIE